MSISTLIRPKRITLRKQIKIAEMPPVTVEGPRAEILRFLDRAIKIKGEKYRYVARWKMPAYFDNNPVFVEMHQGCLIGMILMMKGITPGTVRNNNNSSIGNIASLSWFPAEWRNELGLLSQIQTLNDESYAWGEIRERVTAA